MEQVQRSPHRHHGWWVGHRAGTVKRLLEEGGVVHAIDVNEAGLEATAKAAAADGNAERLTTGVLDISNEGAVAEHVGAVTDRLGGLDVLVNAAGIIRAAHTHDCTLDMWNQVININLTGTFLMCRAAMPALLASGQAAIVNFSSTSATFAHPYMAAYAASKGGIDALTHTLAAEYGKRGIRVERGARRHPERHHRRCGGMIPAGCRLVAVRQDVSDHRRRFRAARHRRGGDRDDRLRRRQVGHRHRDPHRRRGPRLIASARGHPYRRVRSAWNV